MTSSPKKPKPPLPPPSTPTRADANQFVQQTPSAVGVNPSLINTSSQGLLESAKVKKRSLIGGSAP